MYLLGVLALASVASALEFATLKKVAADPVAAKMSCASMSYGVSCRGKLPAYGTDTISVQWKSKTRHIIMISAPTFTLNQVAPKRTAAPREGYQKITSGPFAGYFVRQLGKSITLRSSGALDGLYDD